jgi:signal transduction histidine kinase
MDIQTNNKVAISKGGTPIMKRAILFTGAIFVVLFSWMPAFPGEFTPEDAKNLTVKAVDLIEKMGIDKAREILHDKNGGYRQGAKGELYVFVVDWNGVWLAYPPRPSGVGKNVLNVKDPDGKYLVKDMIAITQNKDEGWSEYRWLNPETGKIQHKISYVKRIPGQKMFAASGIYK